MKADIKASARLSHDLWREASPLHCISKERPSMMMSDRRVSLSRYQYLQTVLLVEQFANFLDWEVNV